MTTSRDVIELRPDSSEYLRGLRARGKWLVPVFVIIVLRVAYGIAQGGLDAVLGGMVLVALVGGLGIAAVHIRTSVMLLSPDHLEHDGVFVRRRSIPVEGARGLLAPMGAQLGAPTVDVLAVQSATGRTIRIAGGLWTRADLERIAHHAGVPIEPAEISGKEFERRVPGSVPLRFRRPAVFALAVGLPLFSAIILGVVAWYA